MSVKAISWAFDQVLPPNEKVVLLALADYADDRGYCFPGVETLAAKASMHPRTIIRMLAALVDKGLLTRERRHLQNGNRTSDGHQLVFHPQVTDRHMTETEDEVTAVPSTGEPSVEPPVQRTPRAPRQVQMPVGLSWNNGHSMKALARGVDVEVEFEKFKNHHLAKASRFADWDRAFYSWLDRARPETGGFGRQGAGGRPQSPSPTDRMNAVLAIQDPRETGELT